MQNETRNEGVSIVIPIFNEEENIPILSREIDDVMKTLDLEWECIWVDDNSNDKSWEQITLLAKNHRGLSLERNSGQSTALMAGIDLSIYPIVVTLDGDLQNDPQDIPKLLNLLTANVDVVSGYRENRKDSPLSRKLPSYIANRIARRITGLQIRDLGCTLRAFRKSLIKQNRILGEMHRVILIYFANSGARILETPTNHRKRIYGKSKYGIERTFKFIADLFLAKTLKTVSSKPLYFFGSISIGIMSFAIILGIIAVSLRVFNVKEYFDTSLIVGSIIMFVGSITVVCIGLIGEVLIRTRISVDRDFQYATKKTHNYKIGVN